MEPHDIVEILIKTDRPVSARILFDASVHLPHRGTRWIASFRGETGKVWRSTGLRDRELALVMANAWEADARRRQAARPPALRKPTMRIRPGSGEREMGLLSQAEVAAILRISERAVREIERQAFDKLRQHPALRDFWHEYQTGEIREAAVSTPSAWALSRDEIAAVYALARTPEERQALEKLSEVAAWGCDNWPRN
jgi:hypothetical protein